MKVIYIAGKYRDNTEWGVKKNIEDAEKAAIQVWQLGAVALCPHKNTAFFGGIPGCPDELWLEGDLELVRRCDAIYVVKNWRESSGAVNEVRFAKDHNIPVLYTWQDLRNFISPVHESIRKLARRCIFGEE